MRRAIVIDSKGEEGGGRVQKSLLAMTWTAVRALHPNRVTILIGPVATRGEKLGIVRMSYKVVGLGKLIEELKSRPQPSDTGLKIVTDSKRLPTPSQPLMSVCSIFDMEREEGQLLRLEETSDRLTDVAINLFPTKTDTTSQLFELHPELMLKALSVLLTPERDRRRDPREQPVDLERCIKHLIEAHYKASEVLRTLAPSFARTAPPTESISKSSDDKKLRWWMRPIQDRLREVRNEHCYLCETLRKGAAKSPKQAGEHDKQPSSKYESQGVSKRATHEEKPKPDVVSRRRSHRRTTLSMEGASEAIPLPSFNETFHPPGYSSWKKIRRLGSQLSEEL